MPSIYRLKVTDFHAWAPGVSDPAAWENWAQTDTTIIDNGEKPLAKAVPAMTRRRLTTLGRAVMETTLATFTEEDRQARTPVLFATRWGDIGLSVKLLEELTSEGSVSPMGFSTSVHNGIGGLFTIIAKHRANVVALSGAETTASSAMIEALGLLADGAESVLVTLYDEKTPDVFAGMHPENFTFSVTLRLALAQDSESGFTVNIAPDVAPTDVTDTTVMLEALRFLLTDAATHIEHGDPVSYRWEKSPALVG